MDVQGKLLLGMKVKGLEKERHQPYLNLVLLLLSSGCFVPVGSLNVCQVLFLNESSQRSKPDSGAGFYFLLTVLFLSCSIHPEATINYPTPTPFSPAPLLPHPFTLLAFMKSFIIAPKYWLHQPENLPLLPLYPLWKIFLFSAISLSVGLFPSFFSFHLVFPIFFSFHHVLSHKWSSLLHTLLVFFVLFCFMSELCLLSCPSLSFVSLWCIPFPCCLSCCLSSPLPN